MGENNHLGDEPHGACHGARISGSVGGRPEGEHGARRGRLESAVGWANA